MADNKYKLQFTLSNGETINAGEIVAPQGPKGDKGDSADIPYSSSTPFMDGEGSVGSANTVARGDHRHPSDTSRQEKLVSGENIKTINGQSVLGSGDIPISGGSEYVNTSEIVDISLTASDDITSLANKILANKTKVSKISAYDSNVVRILGNNPYPSYQASYISLYFTVLAYNKTILVTCVPSNVDGPSTSAKTTYINNLYAPDGNYYWYACNWDTIDAAYPVGSVYLNAEAIPGSYDPASIFGGTWTALPNEGTNETASLIMTEQAISSSSFSFESGAGTVVADEFFVVHNADYSIMQITGRLKVTPSSTSGGTVGVKFNIGSNIIKKTSQRRQCGVYYDGSGGHESVWIQIKTSGDIVIYNNSTYVNLPTTEAMWSVNAIFFNKSSDGDIMYRWKRIA